jgi:hypothetical protein
MDDAVQSTKMVNRNGFALCPRRVTGAAYCEPVESGALWAAEEITKSETPGCRKAMRRHALAWRHAWHALNYLLEISVVAAIK